MRKSKKKTKPRKLSTILLIILISIISIYENEINQALGLPTVITPTTTDLLITYLDVGQADAILIQNKDEAMLIDAGNNEDGALLVEYFKNLGIEDFKYLVGTHPHEDHIGGLDDIINSFEIDTIYLPDATTNTTTFTDVLDAIEKKDLKITIPKTGEEFYLGEAKITVIYTTDDTSNLNNTSIILKLVFGNTSFLFTGDTTNEVEKKILQQDIQADVLKVAHHGSKYSTSKNFLDKVNPKYAIISVGKDNNYNHPEKELLKRLETKNINIYRTDKMGSIFIKSNGEEITITNKKTNTNGDNNEMGY